RTRVLPGSASKLWTGAPDETSRLLAAQPQPLEGREIQKQMPEKVTLVQFSVQEDRVLIWRLNRDREDEDFFEKQIDRQKLEDLVAQIRTSDPETWGPASETLFYDLVRPWIEGVPEEER